MEDRDYKVYHWYEAKKYTIIGVILFLFSAFTMSGATAPGWVLAWIWYVIHVSRKYCHWLHDPYTQQRRKELEQYVEPIPYVTEDDWCIKKVMTTEDEGAAITYYESHATALVKSYLEQNNVRYFSDYEIQQIEIILDYRQRNGYCPYKDEYDLDCFYMEDDEKLYRPDDAEWNDAITELIELSRRRNYEWEKRKREAGYAED